MWRFLHINRRKLKGSIGPELGAMLPFLLLRKQHTTKEDNLAEDVNFVYIGFVGIVFNAIIRYDHNFVAWSVG